MKQPFPPQAPLPGHSIPGIMEYAELDNQSPSAGPAQTPQTPTLCLRALPKHLWSCSQHLPNSMEHSTQGHRPSPTALTPPSDLFSSLNKAEKNFRGSLCHMLNNKADTSVIFTKFSFFFWLFFFLFDILHRTDVVTTAALVNKIWRWSGLGYLAKIG